MAAPQKVLTIETVSPRVLQCEYAVRGELYLAAQKRSKEGKKVVFTNSGNPHALGQSPISFNREVLALMTHPALLDHPAAAAAFQPDAVARARLYLANAPGGIGAYGDSRGQPIFREECAKYITRRDGIPASAEDVYITNGASEAVACCLNTVLRDQNDGIMVPIPQYPLYSALVRLLDGQLVGYELCEEATWGLNTDTMRRSLREARARGVTVRALVFINPGNPTGQCLTQPQLEDLIRFCYEERIVLLADEVYQDNVYAPGRAFVSSRKVLHGMGAPYRDHCELIQFHTVSKGVYGECGMRGGYFHATNIDPEVAGQMYKILSINLSPNILGGAALALMCNPPRPGDASYPRYEQEKRELLQSLCNRARRMSEAFNSAPGINCQEVEGALYAFPQITLPPAAIAAAKAAGKAPDVFYCLRLLEATGISTVPGSGFGQKEGTFHFRTTILPPESEFDSILGDFLTFHNAFMEEFGGAGALRARL
mmetsp:Transcript_16073/g.22146  ORF Transcript_16073/g.22146 Transcript_16073/m.22146 type:complete len:485 (-) Transcript_16073:486-1940(-)|eukprot:CAMPEP_0194576716 /NCGR_PEP_ID=MMETSP0292-20121207/11746_1 /TAXON_ID=39354 /ORGANISM="Heterosigma akashiwo, Strain CCMP2393" /LENGTH=484 /DNA_ID=CAMNT_0039428873 /DNA_START=68 /DNA_END=1522 /DNA_ORIENTATION=-